MRQTASRIAILELNEWMNKAGGPTNSEQNGHLGVEGMGEQSGGTRQIASRMAILEYKLMYNSGPSATN